jgi:hypothetical protein
VLIENRLTPSLYKLHFSQRKEMGMLVNFQVKPKTFDLRLLFPCGVACCTPAFWHRLPHHHYFGHLSNQVEEKGV